VTVKIGTKVILVVFALVGVYLAYDSVRSFLPRRAFLQGALHTQGKIVDYLYHDSPGEGSGVYFPRIQYQTADGRSFVFESSSGSNPPVPKDRPMGVLYHPEHPEDAREDSLMGLWGRPILEAAGSLFLFVFILLFCMASPSTSESHGEIAREKPVYRPSVQWVYLFLGVCFLLVSFPLLYSIISDNFYKGSHPSSYMIMVLCLVLLFPLVGLSLWVGFFKSLWRRGRQSAAFCNVQSSEAVIGGTFRARVDTGAPAFDGPLEASLTNLRLITLKDNDGSNSTASEVLWCGTQKIESSPSLFSGGGRFYEINIQVPSGAHPTETAQDAVYAWKLELDSFRSPGKFHAEFPVNLLAGGASSETETVTKWNAFSFAAPEGIFESQDGEAQVLRTSEPFKFWGSLVGLALFLGAGYPAVVWGLGRFELFFFLFFGCFSLVGLFVLDQSLGRSWELRIAPKEICLRRGRRSPKVWGREVLECVGVTWNLPVTSNKPGPHPCAPALRTNRGTIETLYVPSPDAERSQWVAARVSKVLGVPIKDPLLGSTRIIPRWIQDLVPGKKDPENTVLGMPEREGARQGSRPILRWVLIALPILFFVLPILGMVIRVAVGHFRQPTTTRSTVMDIHSCCPVFFPHETVVPTVGSMPTTVFTHVSGEGK
jgi:hypothetical protein